MTVFQSFLDVFKKNSELEWMYDMDFVSDTSSRAYLKKMAIDSCLNFVGRTISQSEFRYKEKDKVIKNDWYYKLNVRPNTDDSASTFWQKYIYKLLYDNEALIVLSDTNDLLIADSFVRKEYALYEDTFSEVIVKGYTFERSFKMNEVIYMSYNNEDLDSFIVGLFGDYGEMFGRMIEVSLRNNQIRGTVDVDTMQGFDEDKKNKLQNYIDKLYSAFSKNSVAIVPQLKGFNYNEITNQTKSSGQSIDELSKLKKSLIDDVARMIGVPSALIHGEMADLEANMEAYIKFCITPLLKKIEDELNAKLFETDEYLNGNHIEVIGINKPDIFKRSESIDKLISSGAFNKNEVRIANGYEPVDGGDKFVITKNFQSEDDITKGGDANEED